MSAGIEITVGEHTAKVYEITNRGRPAFQVSFYKAGKRQRLTFSKLARAKAEARIELSKLVSVNPEVQQLSTPDMEALVLARRHLDGMEVPVHVSQAPQTVPKPAVEKTVGEVIEEYAEHLRWKNRNKRNHKNEHARISRGVLRRALLE